MAFKWRKWNRAIHRDFGYLFFGMVLVYAISGIAINHIDDWNPNYVILTEDIKVDPPGLEINKDQIKKILEPFNESDNYKSHYFPNDEVVKIFLKNGTAYINLLSGNGLIENTKRRPLFREVNYLHYNPIKYWTWYSDIFAGALILLGISGVLISRGAAGITKRGAWMTIFGILIPVIYLFIYFY
jgi:hypothetical protein